MFGEGSVRGNPLPGRQRASATPQQASVAL